MKQNLITDVIQGMLPYLNNAQSKRLQEIQYRKNDYKIKISGEVKNKRAWYFFISNFLANLK